MTRHLETDAFKECFAPIAYVGKMAAAATHEIKNNLAVINESAGLLSDLSVMAEQGHPLSPEKVKSVSEKMERQVKRADMVIRKLNQFCHTTDQQFQPIDLAQSIGFAIEMGDRIFKTAGMAVQITPPPSPVRIDTRLIYFETLVWQIIEAVMAQKVKVLLVSFENNPDGPAIWFAGKAQEPFPANEILGQLGDIPLAEGLGASVKLSGPKDRIGLVFESSNFIEQGGAPHV